MSSIYFAGEATYSQHISSVHGAYMSGIKVANQIDNKSSKLNHNFINFILILISLFILNK